MKIFNKFLYLATALAFVAVSCEPEPAVEPGPQEVDGCYGVYFPAQDASGSHILSPADAKELEIKLARTVSDGAITVPVISSFSEDNIFTVTEASFADGQDQTTFKVSFPSIEEGTTYEAHFRIEDNKYASIYSSNATGLDFSIMQVEMVTLKDESGKNDAVVTFNVNSSFLEDQGIDPYVITGKIRYYELNNVRYCETVTDNGIWQAGVELKFNWYTKVAYNDGQAVEVPFQSTTYTIAVDDSGTEYPVDAMDYFNYFTIGNPQAALAGYTFPQFVTNYGANYQLSYYDGHGGFYFYDIFNITGSGYWYGSPSNDIAAIADGYLRVDYSLDAAQTGVSAAGKVPVSFTLGADVAKVVYNFAEGKLSKTQIENAKAELKADSENVITASGNYEFDLGKTGEYTLIAVAFDDKDKAQNSVSASITYLASADAADYAVVINGGVGSAEKYAPKGINSDTSLEVYLYGEDIVEAKIGVFKFMDLAADFDACVSNLLKTKALKDEILEQINGDGYVDVATGLLPGTDYYLLVYASNGYSETVDYFGPATTTGDPLPIYQQFDANSYDDEFELENAAAWCKTWNYYAVDYYGSTGLRDYLGKVTITPSETETEGPDGSGYYDEYVIVDGLFPNAVVDGPEYGYEVGNCKLEMDVYAGIMYSFSGTTADGVCTIHHYAAGDGKFYNGVSYCSAFIPVLDGYYAFVDVSSYASSYNFSGLRVVQTYVWDAFYDLLLVDPAKDNNGVASINKAVSDAKAKLSKEYAKAESLGLTGEKAARKALEGYMADYNGISCNTEFAGITDGVCPVNIVTPVSVNYIGKAVPAMSVKSKNINLK